MRITVRTLLIYVGCVAVALGQARLPLFVSSVCLIPEIMVLACFVPLRLSFWFSGGIVVGILLGLVAAGAYFHGTEIDPISLARLTDLRSHFAAETGRLERCFAYGGQVGAVLGGTLGLVAGQLRPGPVPPSSPAPDPVEAAVP